MLYFLGWVVVVVSVWHVLHLICKLVFLFITSSVWYNVLLSFFRLMIDFVALVRICVFFLLIPK